MDGQPPLGWQSLFVAVKFDVRLRLLGAIDAQAVKAMFVAYRCCARENHVLAVRSFHSCAREQNIAQGRSRQEAIRVRVGTQESARRA